LTNTIHIVAFSGGLASSVVAKMVSKEDDVILLFHDTKTEPKDNYRFRWEVSDYLGIKITERFDGRDIWQLFQYENYLGNARNTMCSRILKQEQSRKFCKENLPCVIYFGFTIDEWRRAQNNQARYKVLGIDAEFPLIENRLSKECCRLEVEKWGIKPPQMYEHFDHANCMPCIKGKLTYWGLIYKYERDAWDRAVEAEKEHCHTILTDGRTLEIALPDCIRLADKYESDKQMKGLQETLFDVSCECLV